eukprot:3314309-Heterocapsa_arctica.AAC.1
MQGRGATLPLEARERTFHEGGNEVKLHLEFWPRYLANAKPQTLRLNDDSLRSSSTSKAEEDDGVATGAVYLDPLYITKEYFTFDVPDDDVR